MHPTNEYKIHFFTLFTILVWWSVSLLLLCKKWKIYSIQNVCFAQRETNFFSFTLFFSRKMGFNENRKKKVNPPNGNMNSIDKRRAVIEHNEIFLHDIKHKFICFYSLLSVFSSYLKTQFNKNFWKLFLLFDDQQK